MKTLAALVMSLLTIGVARGQEVNITSPDQASTFAYAAVILHELAREHESNALFARVTFSNYQYAGDTERRVDEQFDFRFPTLRFDPRNHAYVAVAPGGREIAVAQEHPSFPFGGYVLTPQVKIVLVNRSGQITAILNATREPRGGNRWVEINENWSLQNLLALGLNALTR